MEKRYDLIVIGTGVASGAASRCREAGWTVAVIDSRPVGGTCALRGCRPKKILVAAAEAVHTPRDMAGKGVRPGDLAIDWRALLQAKRAAVGHTEETARTQGLRFRTRWEDTSSWLSSKRLGETASGYKVLVEEDSGRLLGAHLLGPHAAEVINVFAVAIRFRVRADDLKRVLFAYPTSAADIPFMV